MTSVMVSGNNHDRKFNEPHKPYSVKKKKKVKIKQKVYAEIQGQEWGPLSMVVSPGSDTQQELNKQAERMFVYC